MPLLDERNTLKGYITRAEAFRDSVAQNPEEANLQEIADWIDKLQAYNEKLSAINQKLLTRAGVVKENEEREHSGLISRIIQVSSQLEEIKIKEVRRRRRAVDGGSQYYDTNPEVLIDNVPPPRNDNVPPSVNTEAPPPMNNDGPPQPNPTFQTGGHLDDGLGAASLVGRDMRGLESTRLSFRGAPLPQTTNNQGVNLESVLAQLMQHQMRAEERVQRMVDSLNSSITNVSRNVLDSTNSDTRRTHTKLPVLTLPEFTGDRSNWMHFRDMFLSLIANNPRISKVDKLQYLMSAVKGNAKKMIDTIALTENNYEVAWNILTTYYDDHFALTQSQVERFIHIPALDIVTEETFTSMYTTALSVFNSLEAINEMSSPDPWVIYLFLEKLDVETKDQWAREKDNTRTPTVKEFMAFLAKRLKAIQVAHRMPQRPTLVSNKSNSHYAKPHQASVLSATVESPCSICKQTGHLPFKCPSFMRMKPVERLQGVRDHNLCRKCLNLGHQTRACPTTIVCKKCHKHHNTLIHDSFYPVGGSQPTAGTTHSASHNLSTQSNAAATVQVAQPPSTQIASSVIAPPPSVPSATTPVIPVVVPEHPIQPTNQVLDASVTVVQDNQAIATTTTSKAKRVFLETAIVHVFDGHGVPVQCRALLDAGAQANLMTQSLYQKLRIPRTVSDLHIGGIGAGGTIAKFQAQCHVKSMNQESQFSMNCHIVTSVLLQKIPNWSVDTSVIRIPENVVLADPTWHHPQSIDLLISNEVYNELITGQMIRLGPGLPVLKESTLGWIISGSCSQQPVINATAIVSAAPTLSSIDVTLKKFWEMEQISIPQKYSPLHNTAEEIFKSTTKRDDTGRYIVHVPFKPSASRLHNNLPNATKQFLRLNQRLTYNPELKQLYHDAMQENFDKGYFEKVPVAEIHRPCYYMPHHCVMKKSTGPTIKIRVVMNASSKSQSGLSLNDVTIAGPVLQPDIISILLGFREKEYVFTCDITQMYPQILIHPPHRDFFRILWQSIEGGPIEHFRARGVCFGATSSPYLAIRVLMDLAEKSEDSHRLASRLLKRCFYVDDCLASFSTATEAQEAASQLTELLSGAGMTLAKWSTNEPSILPFSTTIDDHPMTTDSSSTLGMIWQPAKDQFIYKAKKCDTQINTKREALSFLASLYDPLGLVNPIVVKRKLMLQSIWSENLQWDVLLPAALAAQWQAFQDALPDIEAITIPRWTSSISQSEIKELHIFADASKVAFGAAAYVVTAAGNDPKQRVSHLVLAKSRIAPATECTSGPNGASENRHPVELNNTIPRLELCAAVLASNMLKKLKDSISVPEYFMWSDSTAVLGQIRSTRAKFDAFVLNRITEIQTLTDVSRWHYVPTSLNPADIVSRGMYPRELKNSPLWWNGPKYITEDVKDWPIDPSGRVSDEEEVVLISVPEPFPIHPLEKLLSLPFKLERILRVLSYVLRFSSRSSPFPIGPPTSNELFQAERVLTRFVQDTHLGVVSEAIKKGSLHDNKQLAAFHSLCPFLDDDGIIRVGGRLENAYLPFDTKHPILLPKGRFATLVASRAHITNSHAGPQALLAIMRQQYWPLGGKYLTKRIVRLCRTCWRHRPVLMQQRMGDLPGARIEFTRPFATCGVDFCGPFMTRPAYKRGGMATKTYVAVYVCLTTKAIHLEVVGNLTTESFIASLKRFIARRGIPTHMYSDNATNFKGACTLLEAFFEALENDPQLQHTLAERRMTWHFNPPRSPHHGGMYEAAVKAMKYHLKREAGSTIFTFEEFNTITAQIESILNSRPITSLPDDPNELTALTPGHFLIGRALNALPDMNYVNVNPNHITRWQRCQQITQEFAARWKREYLTTLQQRTKWRNEIPNIKVGDLVLMSEEHVPPHTWPLGVIDEVFPGRDGRCRVVRVRTAKGSYVRAVQKLALMPEGLPPSTSAPLE
ncbi:Aspartic peptidase domain superfamily [Sergentomyia squamirostris]